MKISKKIKQRNTSEIRWFLVLVLMEISIIGVVVHTALEGI